MDYKTRWLLLGVLCLAFLVTAACKRTDGESNNAAGLKALQQGRYAEAEKSFLAAVEKTERFGPQDPRLANGLNNLALLYHDQGKYAEAEPLYKRSLAILEKALGPEHPNVATGLGNYIALLRKTNREAEAARMESRARAIWAKRARENPTK